MSGLKHEKLTSICFLDMVPSSFAIVTTELPLLSMRAKSESQDWLFLVSPRILETGVIKHLRWTTLGISSL